jgi:hypothetical protein
MHARCPARLLVLTYVLLLFSDAILRIIGRQGAAILVRVMGIIVCSLAGGNRADDIGSGKLGTRSALALSVCFQSGG